MRQPAGGLEAKRSAAVAQMWVKCVEEAGALGFRDGHPNALQGVSRT